MRDLVLKSCINGVELLIFSSKILQANSSGELNEFIYKIRLFCILSIIFANA